MNSPSIALRATLIALALAGPAAAADRIDFQSHTPQDYAAILDGRYKQSPVTLHGHFSRPPSGSRWPAVVVVPDSGGHSPWLQTTIADALNAAGIAAFVIDSFAGRGVGETATDQGRVPMSASVFDAYAALAYLAGRPDVDAARIGVTGFSRGGVAAMFTAERRLTQAVRGDAPGFAAHLPFYPGCSTVWMNPTPTPAPVQFMLGEKDDYTPAANCIRLVEQLKAAGGQASYKVLFGARHSFMSNTPPRMSPQAQTYGNCDLRIQDDGQIRDMISGATTQEGWRPFVAKVMQSCGGRGASVGGDDRSREAGVADMVAFFRQHLRP